MKVYNTDYKRELVQLALNSEPEERTPDEIDTLKRLTIAFNFFKNLPPDVHTELCKCPAPPLKLALLSFLK
jgi:hypothetical protein